jgi:hypothetical protein
MCLGSITAYNKKEINIPDFPDGIRHRSSTHRCDQTGHRWSMSRRGTLMHVVGFKYRPSQFLHKEILFTRASG